MKLIKANERGYFDHGWLKTFHTFSFADYYNPDRMYFGKLRVVNDDIVQGYHGFAEHTHQNMEIISIPLSGKLEHKDSTGESGIIIKGEVQVMSAGTGVLHSEKNPVAEPVNFIQIWIYPDKNNVEPRYEQKKFEESGWINKPQLLVSPNSAEGSLWIHQKAFLSRLKITNQQSFSYNYYNENANGLFLFVLEGKAVIGDVTCNRRDSLMFEPGEIPEIIPQEEIQLLFIEIPM